MADEVSVDNSVVFKVRFIQFSPKSQGNSGRQAKVFPSLCTMVRKDSKSHKKARKYSGF
ncbi:hypothetical protein Aconfl_17590 [Algoriphagus confluentis]|uniref:Uncharacterized protein n=1 Tax=Algoriphagus confluentis TaxID=1697556 RepID=A0ABQ6PN90_9BACT|nr:hypothetical protein Aconfl_17590 [Algoriphagus confluentis]